MAPPPVRREIRRLLALGMPVVATQLGMMMLGIVDTIMLGRVGVLELDAAALGNVWIFGTTTFAMGLLMGMDPVVSQSHGAGDRTRIGDTLQQGVVIAVVTAIPLTAAWLATSWVLGGLGQSPALVDAAHDYVVTQVPSVAPFLVYVAMRRYLQGRGITAPALWVTLAANAFNAAANWALIFGHLGFPAMGLRGAAIATMSTRILLMVGLFALMVGFRLHRDAWSGWSRRAFDRRGLAEIIGFGIPIAIQYGLEGWAFQAATLLAGWLGDVDLAAHVVVLNWASLMFMVPMGMSIGASTRVGNLIGAGDRHGAARAAWIAVALGAAFMAGSALLFVTARHALPRLFTPDVAVIALAATVFPIAAAFQLFDGIQAVIAGVLRGMGRTRPAVVFNLVGFYGLALPIGWLLADTAGAGLVGLWWGLCGGLATVALAGLAYLKARGPDSESFSVPDR